MSTLPKYTEGTNVQATSVRLGQITGEVFKAVEIAPNEMHTTIYGTDRKGAMKMMVTYSDDPTLKIID